MTTIVIVGNGHIGQAVAKFVKQLDRVGLGTLSKKWLDQGRPNIVVWDAAEKKGVEKVDIASLQPVEITDKLKSINADYVINALPFHLNEKVALGAFGAGCSYIDFTEDDLMADTVQAIYRNQPKLVCAVKCGLAPGFINYLGHDLARKIDMPTSLMISVGALPRNVNWQVGRNEDTYNLTWSVDGLVNEYIRPCRVRMNGIEKSIDAVTGIESVYADGRHYEAAFTSGGIGSLVSELTHIPNVYYKTLRYPGHYDYVKAALERTNGDFEQLKKEFLEVFPYNRDDMIVVYAEVRGRMDDGLLRRETFSCHYEGVKGMTSIQSTTAGGGVAILEMMILGKLKGVINHKDVPFDDFVNTVTIKNTYKEIA